MKKILIALSLCFLSSITLNNLNATILGDTTIGATNGTLGTDRFACIIPLLVTEDCTATEIVYGCWATGTPTLKAALYLGGAIYSAAWYVGVATGNPVCNGSATITRTDKPTQTSEFTSVPITASLTKGTTYVIVIAPSATINVSSTGYADYKFFRTAIAYAGFPYSPAPTVDSANFNQFNSAYIVYNTGAASPTIPSRSNVIIITTD